MVKVSITLPNNALITFESEEPEVIHEIVGMVLRDLPRDLMQTPGLVNGEGGHPGEPGNGKAPPVVEIIAPVEQLPEQPSSGKQPVATPAPEARTAGKAVQSPRTAKATTAKVARPPAAGAEASFAEFCRTSNPLGDMRRVVVAAEGARRFLDAESVDAEGLSGLFVLAGWARPHSFVQTLRNAARSKFRWLERVPGRSGFYTVTDLGRSTALGG